MAIPLSPFAQRLYDELHRLPDVDDALAKTVDAIGAPYEDGAWVRGLGTDLTPYRPAMKVATAPGWLLPWLGQFVGVTVPRGTSDVDARALILARTHQLRGLPQTILDTTKALLSGSKFAYLQQHADGNPFKFRVYVRTAEVADADAIRRAITAVKPGAFTFELVLSSALTFDAALNTFDAAQGTIDNPGSPPNP
jgi:hypothetical protein